MKHGVRLRLEVSNLAGASRTNERQSMMAAAARLPLVQKPLVNPVTRSPSRSWVLIVFETAAVQ